MEAKAEFLADLRERTEKALLDPELLDRIRQAKSSSEVQLLVGAALAPTIRWLDELARRAPSERPSDGRCGPADLNRNRRRHAKASFP